MNTVKKATKGLDAAGIVTIINAAGEAGVAKLEFGQLKIEFIGEEPQYAYAHTSTTAPSPDEIERAQLKAEIAAAEDDLQFTDPLAFEEKLSQISSQE